MKSPDKMVEKFALGGNTSHLYDLASIPGYH